MAVQNFHLTAGLLLLATLFGCNIVIGESIQGSGIEVVRSESVGEVRHLVVSSALQVKVYCGEEPGVEVSGDDNIVSHVDVIEDDGRLSIQLKGGSYRQKLPLEVVVSCASLESIDASGACKVEIAGVDADEFELESSGACKITVEGRAENLAIDVSGASKIDTTECSSATVKASGSGASGIKVWATEVLHAELSGASHLSYTGEPTETDFDTSGVSKIDKLETAR